MILKLGLHEAIDTIESTSSKWYDTKFKIVSCLAQQYEKKIINWHFYSLSNLKIDEMEITVLNFRPVLRTKSARIKSEEYYHLKGCTNAKEKVTDYG